VPVLRGLLAPDLPVVLWVRGEVPGVEILYPLAAKIVFDAASRGDATSALERLEKAAGPHRRVADLNWGRLTRWRQAVSQMFESPEQRKKLDRISRITVGYRPGDPPVRAYYLAAWFRRALGRDVAFDFSEETASRGTIRSVAVAGAEVKCSVARAGAGESVELRMDDLVSPSIFPPLTDYDLMREELSISGADLVYDEVRRLALELARSDRGRS
jgi:glucose-6-phosphate dehydrogenase assembly protein OpcA